ncbi:MAG: AEC family transporter [Christensenellales bacterium]
MSIAAQVVILFLVVLVGVLCRRLGYFTDETIRGVTQLVVNVTLPVLTVYNMQRPFDMHVLMNFLLTLLISLAAILASIGGASLLFRHRPHDKHAVLLNMAGFSNSGFMGYPIILAINPDWMIYAVAYNVALSSRLVDSRREPVSGAAERQPRARAAQPERHRRVSRLCGFLPEHHAARHPFADDVAHRRADDAAVSCCCIGHAHQRSLPRRSSWTRIITSPPRSRLIVLVAAGRSRPPPSSAASGRLPCGARLTCSTAMHLRHAVRHAGRALRRRQPLCRRAIAYSARRFRS